MKPIYIEVKETMGYRHRQLSRLDETRVPQKESEFTKQMTQFFCTSTIEYEYTNCFKQRGFFTVSSVKSLEEKYRCTFCGQKVHALKIVNCGPRVHLCSWYSIKLWSKLFLVVACYVSLSGTDLLQSTTCSDDIEKLFHNQLIWPNIFVKYFGLEDVEQIADGITTQSPSVWTVGYSSHA